MSRADVIAGDSIPATLATRAKQHIHLIALALITLIGLLLRIPAIGDSLFRDELVPAAVFLAPLPDPARVARRATESSKSGRIFLVLRNGVAPDRQIPPGARSSNVRTEHLRAPRSVAPLKRCSPVRWSLCHPLLSYFRGVPNQAFAQFISVDALGKAASIDEYLAFHRPEALESEVRV